MLTSDATQTDALLKGYLSSQTVLIYDPVNSSRAHLANTLMQLGVAQSQLTLVQTLDEAKNQIQNRSPKLIFSVTECEELQKIKKDEAVLVLVTDDASQSRVAIAAEENVDAFILKPYQTKTLETALAKIAKNRLNPTPYLNLLDAGKKKLLNAEYLEAIELFKKATSEDPNPALAYFYAGQAELMRSVIENSRENFEKGLFHSKIHHKCLVGLFQVLSIQKKYKDAYQVMNQLVQYYPAHPKRLSDVLRLAIMTENFEDIENFHQIYQALPERDENLKKYMCSALLVTGKYFLRQKQNSQAMETFFKAIQAAGKKTNYYFYVIEALVDFEMLLEASQVLDLFYNIEPECQDYRVSKFLVSTLGSGDLEESIRLGQSLVAEGVAVPSLYERLILQCAKAGQNESANHLFKIASERWPDKRNHFLIAKSIELVPDKESKKC